MGSSGKKKTTMAKMARENKLRERRAIKAAKKDARKQAAADGPPAPETSTAMTDASPDSHGEDARSAFLDVSPEPADPRAKEVALTRLRESKEEELAVFGDMLRTDAREAGASEQELREAQQGHPGHEA